MASSFVLSTPVIFSPATNVPSIESNPNTSSTIVVLPIINLKTSSTTAVALFTTLESFWVIVCPISDDASLPLTSVQRKIVFVSHLPSETLNILSLGYLISAFSLNNNLKNISDALFVPFAW